MTCAPVLLLMTKLDNQIEKSTEIGFVGWPEQFLLQWNRPVEHFGYRRNPQDELKDAARWLSQSPNRRLCCLKSIGALFDPGLVASVGRAHRRDWVVTDASALTAECLTVPGSGVPIVVSYSSRDSDVISAEIVSNTDRRIFAALGSN